jgi:cobalt/nickel transport system permease protein
LLYRTLARLLRFTAQRDLIAAGVAAWATVVLAAAAAALELAISGTSPLKVALPAMVGVHMLIGLGEALITVGVLVFVREVRPDLYGPRATLAAQGSAWIAAGLVLALLVAFASPLASAHPDGLERVAEDKGFLEQAQDAAFEIMPDYTISFIENEAATTIASGVVGVLVVAGVSFLAARGAARSKGAPSTRGMRRDP